MSEVDFSNVYKSLKENIQLLKTKEKIKLSDHHNSSYASIDKISLAQACEATIKAIYKKRNDIREREISLAMEPKPALKIFGITVMKPGKGRTREEALKAIEEENRLTYSSNPWEYISSKQLEIAENLYELCRHSASDKVNVSAEDFSMVSNYMPEKKVNGYR